MARGSVFSESLEERRERTEQLLVELAKTRSREARQHLMDELVRLNLDLADAIAHRYVQRGIDRDDLIQVARLGLVMALRRYRPGSGPGFAAFAAPTIAGEIKRHFRDHGWMVRPPRRIQELRAQAQIARTRLEQGLGRPATAADLAAELGVPATEVAETAAAESGFRPWSLEAPVGSAEATSLGDTLAQEDADLERLPEVLALRSAVAELSPKHRQVLRLRFTEGLTQSQIGRRLGVSQMQVSRILSSTLASLRATLGEPAAAW